MTYYKLIDSYLIWPTPDVGRLVDGTAVSNLPTYFNDNPDVAKENGYYPLRKTECPGENYIPVYTMGDNVIIESWEEDVPNTTLTIEDRLAALEAENAALKAAVEVGVNV